MNALWSYFWPCLAIGLIVGGPAGTVALRRPATRWKALALGTFLSLALAAVWHGPLGGAERFAARVDLGVRQALTYYEMTAVQGHLQRAPLTRRVILAGPADPFQRTELVRLLNQLPAVSATRWEPAGRGLPLILEGFAAAILGFLFGLLLAYLVELRRRYNAQWTW